MMEKKILQMELKSLINSTSEKYPGLFRQAQSNHTALESGAPSLAVMRVRCEDERRVRKTQCCSFEDRRRGHKPRNVK